LLNNCSTIDQRLLHDF